MQGFVIKYDEGAKDSQPNSAQLYPIVNGGPKLSVCLDVPRHNHPLIRMERIVRASLRIVVFLAAEHSGEWELRKQAGTQ